MTKSRVIFVSLIVCATLAVGHAEELSRDREKTALRAEGMLLERCGICHSTDLVTQQRLDRSRWTATVDKMIHWGAPLSLEERNALVNYLAAQYHPQAPVGVQSGGAK